MENELISNQEFKEALENGQMSLSIAVYVEFMNKVFKKHLKFFKSIIKYVVI